MNLEVPPERWIQSQCPRNTVGPARRTACICPDGGDALMIEASRCSEANFLRPARRRSEGTWQPFCLKVADAARTGAPSSGVASKDQDGMDAEVAVFGAMVAGPVFWRNIAHDDVYQGRHPRYTRLAGRGICAVAPDRLIGMGVIRFHMSMTPSPR